MKANITGLYIKRQIGTCGSVTLDFAHNAAIVGTASTLSKANRFTRLVQETDTGKAKYSLQKEVNLIKQKY